MKLDEFREEIAVELEALKATVGELQELQRDVAHREPTVREKAAARAGSESLLPDYRAAVVFLR